MAVDPTDTDLYPLGSDNLLVLQRNASDVDKVVNSTEDTVENRFGENLGTLDYYNRQFQTAVDAIEVSTDEAEGFADDAEASATAAAESETSSGLNAQASANSAISAASSASSTGTALAATNAILGLGVGTSYTDSDGHLIMTYDDGTLASPPSTDASGHLILTI